MKINQLLTLRHLSMLIILIPLIMGCRLPNPFLTEFSKPANVQVIISKEENVGNWALSPGGDKIAYYQSGDSPGAFLLFPVTQQKHELGNCNLFQWLDNMLYN